MKSKKESHKIITRLDSDKKEAKKMEQSYIDASKSKRKPKAKKSS